MKGRRVIGSLAKIKRKECVNGVKRGLKNNILLPTLIKKFGHEMGHSSQKSAVKISYLKRV